MKIANGLRALLFFILFSFLLSYSSLAKDTFSLREAIPLALTNNLEIKITKQELVATQHRINQALRLWWPQLVGTGYSSYRQTNPNDRSQSWDNIPSSVPVQYQQLYKALFLPSNSERYSTLLTLEIKQLLVDNGKVNFQIHLALKKSELANLELMSRKNKIIAETIRHYYELFYDKLSIEKETVSLEQIKRQAILKKDELNFGKINK